MTSQEAVVAYFRTLRFFWRGETVRTTRHLGRIWTTTDFRCGGCEQVDMRSSHNTLSWSHEGLCVVTVWKEWPQVTFPW